MDGDEPIYACLRTWRNKLIGVVYKGGEAMQLAKYISIDLNIHHGAPVITGTRVPVSIVIGSLAAGMTKEDVSGEYDISKEAVEAALAYAAELITTIEVTSLVGD